MLSTLLIEENAQVANARMPPRQACQGKAEAAPRAWILKGALDRLERRYAEIRAARNFCESRYRAADAVTVVAASEQQERTLPGGQGRRSTYDGSIDAPAEAGDEIEGGWRREELLAMDIRRAPQARDL